MALGNVVGSVIFNILLILGLYACMSPMKVHHHVTKVDLWVMCLFALLLLPLSIIGNGLDRLDGVILTSILLLYLPLRVKLALSEAGSTAEDTDQLPPPKSIATCGGYMVLGLVLLIGGAKLVVIGGQAIALAVGIPELYVGLTVVSIGTSLPEICVALASRNKGGGDLVLGSVIGSNIWNIGAVLGWTLLLFPNMPVEQSTIWGEIPMMIATCALAAFILLSHQRIERWEGVVLLLWAATFMTYNGLTAAQSTLLTPMVYWTCALGIPLTGLTLIRSWRPRPVVALQEEA